MKRLLYAALAVLTFAPACSKVDNPVNAKNTKPVLTLTGDGLGFGGDVLVYQAGKVYPFSFGASDPNNHELFITTRVTTGSGTVIIGNPVDGVYPGSYLPNAEGQHSVRITVSDRIDSVSGTLSVSLGRLVSSFIVSPTGDLLNGQELTLDARASQSPHGTIQTFTWFIKLAPDGVVEQIGETQSNTFRWTVGAPLSQHQIGLVVADIETSSDTAWAPITVKSTPPVPNFEVEPFDDPVYEIAEVDTNLTTDVDAPYGDSVVLSQWYIRMLRPTQEPTRRYLSAHDNVAQPVFRNLPGGDYEITLKVTDSAALSAERIREASVWGLPASSFAFAGITGGKISWCKDLVADGGESSAGHRSLGIAERIWMLQHPSGDVDTLAVGLLEVLERDLSADAFGDYKLGLIVRNQEGRSSAPLWVPFSIVNLPPEVVGVKYTFTGNPAGRHYVMTENASHPGVGESCDTIEYWWLVDGGWTGIDRSISTPGISFGPTDGNKHVISLRLVDSKGAEVTKVIVDENVN